MEAHYLIFHPDHARDLVDVQADALVNGSLQKNWKGKVWVDCVSEGNQDPYVFNDGWLYSYCHATQLHRTVGNAEGWVQKDSWLLFCSGDKADQDVLAIDTAFCVLHAHPWLRPNGHKTTAKQLGLPSTFQKHYRDKRSNPWIDHFRFPFSGIHGGVTHTYEASLWSSNQKTYSFLPYSKPHEIVEIPLQQLNSSVAQKIRRNRRGKYPAALTAAEAKDLVAELIKLASIQVVRNIKLLGKQKVPGSVCGGC